MSEDSRQRRSHAFDTLDAWIGAEVTLTAIVPAAIVSATDYRGRLERAEGAGYLLRCANGPTLHLLGADPEHEHALDDFAVTGDEVRVTKMTGPLKGSAVAVRRVS